MLIAAGVVGAVGMLSKLVATISAVRSNRLLGGGGATILAGYGLYYNPLLGTALGLAGGGMARRGRIDAHDAMFDGKPATMQRRRALGWGLFGGGIGLWAVTRAAGLGLCTNERCLTATWDMGYYLSLGATVPGVIMGGYASGYEGYEKRYRHLAPPVTVAPIAHRDAWGLSLSGRF